MEEDVTHLRASALRGGRFGPSARLRGARRGRSLARRLLVAKAWIVIGLCVLAGLTYLRLDRAPITIAGLSERVASGLEQRLGPRWRVALAATALTLHDGIPALLVDGLDLRDADGALVARAPSAVVSVGPLSVLTADPTPRAIVLRGVELRLLLAEDGSVSLLPPDPNAPARPVAAQEESGPPIPPHRIVAALVAAALDRSTIVGALDARLEDARVTLVDARGRTRAGFDDVDARIWTTRRGRRFEASVRGPGGDWSTEGRVARIEETVEASVAITALPVRDVTLMSGISAAFGSDDLTLTAAVDLAMDGAGALTRFTADVSTNAGLLRTRDPFMPHVPIETLAARVAMEPDTGVFAIEDLTLAGGRTRIALAGALTPEPDVAEGAWSLALAGRDAVVRGATASEPSLPVETIALRARGGPDGVVVDELALSGPGIDLALGLSFGGADDRGGMRVDLATGDMPVRTALALWPDFVAPIPRLFLLRAMESGTVRDLDVGVVLTGADLAGLFDQQSLPDEAIAVAFAIDDARLVLDEAFPALEHLTVTGFVSGRDATVDARAAGLLLPDGRRLDAGPGGFRLKEFWDREAIADVSFSARGGLDALVSFLRLPALAGAADLALEPDAVSGDVALDVSFAFPLNRPLVVADLPIRAEGRLENVSATAPGLGERLENGSFALGFAPDGTLTLDGTGDLAGSAVALSASLPRGRPSEVRFAGTLDASALVSAGLLPEGAASGPIGLEAEGRLGPGEAFSARLVADLTGAQVDAAVPGLRKSAGAAGRLAVALDGSAEGIAVSDLDVAMGPAALQGSARLRPDGELDALDLPTFRLSPGDDASLALAREGESWNVRVRGNVLDLRPLLALAKGEGGSGGGAATDGGPDARIDLEVDILGGHGGEVVTNADVEARIVRGTVRSASVAGRFPGAPITATVSDGRLRLETENAGATLRFLDVYDKMFGGRLYLDVGLGPERTAGTLIAWNFALRGEPALSRLVGTQAPTNAVGDARFGVAGPTLDTNEALFTKAQVELVRDGPVITLGDARMWGSQVGFTAEGWIDTQSRRLDVAGSFVPAYGLNNAFAQVPVLGTILGGNQYEGLFAVNFRVQGDMADPTLTVNPLSAIAPGVLRRLFGAGAPTRRGPDLGDAPVLPPLDLSPTR